MTKNNTSLGKIAGIVISQYPDVTREQVEKVIRKVFECIPVMASTMPVQFRGFGTFKLVTTRERPGRNPKTGEPAIVPSVKKLRFKPSKNRGGI